VAVNWGTFWVIIGGCVAIIGVALLLVMLMAWITAKKNEVWALVIVFGAVIVLAAFIAGLVAP
jgi:hypothetical protein